MAFCFYVLAFVVKQFAINITQCIYSNRIKFNYLVLRTKKQKKENAWISLSKADTHFLDRLYHTASHNVSQLTHWTVEKLGASTGR